MVEKNKKKYTYFTPTTSGILIISHERHDWPESSLTAAEALKFNRIWALSLLSENESKQYIESSATKYGLSQF